MTVLNLGALQVNKGTQCVVEPVSFSLDKGESITILGETGSGKSLFAKAILGDLPAGFRSAGAIMLNGQRIDNLSRNQRQSLWGKHITVLPQEPMLALSPLMKIGQQVNEVFRWVVGQNKQTALDNANKTLANLSLAKATAKYPVEISGGMAQRSAFACAQAAGGELLIADEPTKGLDNKSKQQVIDALLEHKQQHALITITHDLDVARALGGKVYVLLQGRWVACNKTFDEWQNDHSDGYSQSLIRSTRYQKREVVNCDTEVLLELNELEVGYGGKPLFKPVSFSIRQGEVIGFAGPSGCGKSTLADVLLGLKHPQSGEVRSLVTFGSAERLKLYQDPPQSFASNVSLRHQLNDVCQLHDIEYGQIERLAAELKVSPEVLERVPEQVSGGELQRVAILRVLLLKPKLLIADEPTTRLDPHIARETLNLIVNSAKSIGCALVLISHNEDELLAHCHKVLRFNNQGEGGQSDMTLHQAFVSLD
ncbi:ABC transporter ATP-binding protein [Vibrio hepatarius]|uniref:ABC transporter ATP-binding protein n=1 Tax=Vibrio hepatarius TaxID=171383 RepID=UPI00142E6A6C|nr:ATP-binding cassette domain-containing protein [Vibrio hepatarius]NIY82570.1 ABC transporter ATP-binding protein [Vibrio hepatarius]